MKQSDQSVSKELLTLLLRSAKRDTIRSIYERITPWEDGAVHSSQNPAGTECIAGDSLVVTSSGLQYIEGLHSSTKVWNGSKCFRPEKHVRYEDVPGYQIFTEYGFELKGSTNHPLWTQRGWVPLEEITTADRVFVQIGQDQWGNTSLLPKWESLKGTHNHINPPEYVTTALAELVGMWLADGSMHDTNGSYGLRISNNDPKVLERFAELAEEALGIHVSVGADTASINAKEAVEYFRLLGIQGTAREKQIPPPFLRAGKQMVRALLRGLSLDTHILTEKRALAFGTQSPEMQRQIHLLLANLGILGSRLVGENCMRLVISRAYLADYLWLIGFIQEDKAVQIALALNGSTIEHKKEDSLFLRVKEIRPWQGNVFDVKMPDASLPQYVANGFLVHNTGRFSHADTFMYEGGSTNLANLPKKTAALDPLFNVRECIIPHESRVLWKADFSQAEARWAAYMAADPVRMKIYEEGIDHYKWFVAILKWDDPERAKEVTKEERDAIGKVGVLAGQYGVSWKTLKYNVNQDYGTLHNVSIDAKTAKKMEAIWPDVFPATVEWWDEIREAVLTDGYLINPFGRRRDFFGRTDSSGAKEALVREAIAFGPQSANADALNTALKTLYEAHDPSLLRVLLQVHDEIVGDCKPQDIQKVKRAVVGTMEVPMHAGDHEFIIPAEFEASSKSWADCREI